VGKRRLAFTLAASLAAAPGAAETFADAVAFLKKHTTVVVLKDAATAARVAVCPDLQGRVMTSTSGGDGGPSFGWINRELLASGRKDPHFNAYGGEDRFWLGPEGGQFALFFSKGQPFDLAHWYTPPAIDTEPYPVERKDASRVSFRKAMALTNYSGARFDLELRREVRLVAEADAWARIGASKAAGVRLVAFESENRIANVGQARWTKETGLVSVWILGMFVPSPATTVVVPVKPGPESTLGPKVNDAYFGKVPADRLIVKDGVVFFRGDGRNRSKIGIPPARALPVLGSYDAAGHVLTLVRFTRPEGAMGYVNSMWQLQDEPYGGDVVNSYNDGPPGPGKKPLGPFYELETSSPAAALGPGETLTHAHLTLHFAGERPALDAIARKALGVGLDEIEAAFGTAGGPAN
jgi:hypothetical protein